MQNIRMQPACKKDRYEILYTFFFVFSFLLSRQKTTEPIAYSGWHLQYENNDDFTYYAIHLTDENNGWIVGYSGAINKTIDGGKTWKSQSNTTTANLCDRSLIDNQTSWICGAENTILKTLNSGQTWNKTRWTGNP